MSNFAQFSGSSRAPIAIINSTSTTASAANNLDLAIINSAKTVLSGALTANTLKTFLNLSGAGELNFVACQGVDATSRTHRFKLTLDGVVVYDATTAATPALRKGILLIGNINDSTAAPTVSLDRVFFNSSCLLEYASNLGETNLTNIGYIYKQY